MNTTLFKGNWVDLVILIALFYFIAEALSLGFWIILVDFLSFLFSLIFALWTYPFIASFLRVNFSLTHSLSNALGFLFTGGIFEALFGFLFMNFIKRLPVKFFKNFWIGVLSIFPALAEGLIFVNFFLTLTLSLPVFPKLKQDITDSKIGGFLVQKTSGLESKLNDVFGGVIRDSLTYLTVKPGTNELIPIDVEDRGLKVDEASEKQMFELVNEERGKRGIRPLTFRQELLPVARAHARDMWERKYFGHISPDGKDVADRLDDRGIEYHIVGENLALAPTVSTAHTGLMNSEGHRENILRKEFRRVAIGVIDNGIYGKMFVQIFTD